MDKLAIYEQRKIIAYRQGQRQEREDPVVNETPLTIMLNDAELATLVCSPYALEELAVGFLVSEGMLQHPDELKDMFVREEQGVVWVETTQTEPRAEGFLRRNFASCCGKGRPTLYYVNDVNQVCPVAHATTYRAGQLMDMIDRLQETSATFQLTGGVHSAALADGEELVVRYEDIGRHNALDRILGYTFMQRIDPADKMILLSGRISSELLVKSARIGVPLVVSRSAPTALAVDLAEDLGITVVGFARGRNLNIYTHADRILD